MSPLGWLVVMRILAGAWFLGAGLRKANRPAIEGLLPGLIRGYSETAFAVYRPFLRAVVLPRLLLFSYLTVIGELAVGLGLLLGLLTIPAAVVGVFMNLNYLLAAGPADHPEQGQNAALILIELATITTPAWRTWALDAWLF